ncbi:MAG: PAS domain-containing protein [Desulfobaccales bacterium]
MGNVERLLLDTMENFLDANKKMERLLGFFKPEFLTMDLTQVFPKEEIERSRSTLGKIVHRGKSDLPDGRIIRKDNQRVPVNFVPSKVEYSDKTIIKGIFRDSTEHGKPDHIQVQLYQDHLSFLQNFFKISSIPKRRVRECFMERRIFPRIYKSLRFEYQVQLQGSEDSFSNRAIMKNISMGGMYFMSETAPILQPDNIADFIFKFQPDQAKPFTTHIIRAKGKVKRIEQPTKKSPNFGIALEFLARPVFTHLD